MSCAKMMLPIHVWLGFRRCAGLDRAPPNAGNGRHL